MATIKQPEWCNYSDAAVPLWGCWSLLAGMVENEGYCKKCERYKRRVMYKPGQLLTIRGRLYRVKRAKRYVPTCLFCDANRRCIRLLNGKILCHNCPADCYLQLVTPKSSLG